MTTYCRECTAEYQEAARKILNYKYETGKLVRAVEKKCSGCNEVKKADDFSHDSRGTGGLTHNCKKCRSIHMKKRRLAGKDK